MAKAAEAALNLDLTASWVVGDRPEDIGLAEAVGASAVYLGAGDRARGSGARGLVVPEPGRRGPVHPGACRRHEPVPDLPTSGRSADGSPVKFPVAPYASAASYFDAYAEEMSRAAKTIEPEAFDRAAAILSEAYDRGARMFSCGNGGSASIANHMQCDHVKGIRTATDLAPQVLSLSTNVELLTAIANDMGYENVFVYQLQSQSRPGDVLIAVSSSGRSANIVQRPHLGPRPRPAHHRDHRLRRRRGQDDGRGRHPRRLHQLRRRRGPAPERHARPGPVHPPVADDRGRDLDDGVLNHDTRGSQGPRKPGARYRRNGAAGTNARSDQPSDR